MTTAQLLDEGVEAARAREQAAFGALAAPADGRIVLFGAGALGRKALAALRSAGVSPLSFADNDPALHGREVDGLAVLAPGEAAERWRDEALFVATVFRPGGNDGMEGRLRQLAALGCRRVTSFLPLAWRFPGVLPHYGADLPSRLLAKAGPLRQVAASWGDEASRLVFRDQIRWRLRGDFLATRDPAPDQYFPRDLFRPRQDEQFVDGGAFDGDTLERLQGAYRRAWAFEPDPLNAARLRGRVDARVTVSEAALGRAAGLARFEARGTPASARSDSGGLEVPVVRLDDVLARETPTFVKLDVEGDELAALEGAAGMLRRAQPVAAVCLYHRPCDLWEIPLFLRNVLPAHALFLRIHEQDGFELVAYAVPRDRCLVPA
jgi:FkbM family methyltransferase